MDKYTEKALQLHNQGNNCCQSVCLAFAEKLNIDEDILFKISEGFGAGMGNLQGICGALSLQVYITVAEKMQQSALKQKHTGLYLR